MRSSFARCAFRHACSCFFFAFGLAHLLMPAVQAQSEKPLVIRTGIVFDERVAALRTKPDVHALIVQRLRRGHRVYVLRGRVDPSGKYVRVAITRRTRGWIYLEAVAFPSQPDDAAKILRLAEAAEDVERLTLCRLMVTHFRSSPLVPEALCLLAGEAERVAGKILKRAQRRLESAGMVNPSIPTTDYFLNEVALDRYNKLGVGFTFDEQSGSYRYDCQAWREILRAFPRSSQAVTARARLSECTARE